MKAAHQKGGAPHASTPEWECFRERRRYEIARNVLAGFAANSAMVGEQVDVRKAVEWADVLLAALEVTE